METALRRHDAIGRATIAAHGGHIFKTLGDAFCCAFVRPQDAFAAALDFLCALAREDFAAVDGLRVRAALHPGTAEERDSDYFGPTLNRVARLLAVAHGGQVIASGVACDLARDALAAHITLKDLGMHRLKDLARPERVYQLIASGLAANLAEIECACEGDFARAARVAAFTSHRYTEFDYARQYTEALSYDRLGRLIAEHGRASVLPAKVTAGRIPFSGRSRRQRAKFRKAPAGSFIG